jgi:hypothetical protein
VIPPRDPASLAAAINEMLESSVKPSQLARQFLLALTPTEVAAKYDAVFRECLKK